MAGRNSPTFAAAPSAQLLCTQLMHGQSAGRSMGGGGGGGGGGRGPGLAQNCSFWTALQLAAVRLASFAETQLTHWLRPCAWAVAQSVRSASAQHVVVAAALLPPPQLLAANSSETRSVRGAQRWILRAAPILLAAALGQRTQQRSAHRPSPSWISSQLAIWKWTEGEEKVLAVNSCTGRYRYIICTSYVYRVYTVVYI